MDISYSFVSGIGRSVGIVRLRTKTAEFVCVLFCFWHTYWDIVHVRLNEVIIFATVSRDGKRNSKNLTNKLGKNRGRLFV
jgi:hypothetical protein